MFQLSLSLKNPSHRIEKSNINKSWEIDINIRHLFMSSIPTSRQVSHQPGNQAILSLVQSNMTRHYQSTLQQQPPVNKEKHKLPFYQCFQVSALRGHFVSLRHIATFAGNDIFIIHPECQKNEVQRKQKTHHLDGWCCSQTASESFRSPRPHHECLHHSLLQELARVGAADAVVSSNLSHVSSIALPISRNKDLFNIIAKRYLQTIPKYGSQKPNHYAFSM